jgi:hypothetical protein
MAIQKWEYCKLTIDHFEGIKPQSVMYVFYGREGETHQVIAPDEFGRFLAQLGLDCWELAGVSGDQPPPPGVTYRESWVFKRPI